MKTYIVEVVVPMEVQGVCDYDAGRKACDIIRKADIKEKSNIGIAWIKAKEKEEWLNLLKKN